MVKPHWNNEGMCDAFNMNFHVTDLYAMNDWILTVCIANFLPFFREFLGIIMKGSGVAVVAFLA